MLKVFSIKLQDLEKIFMKNGPHQSLLASPDTYMDSESQEASFGWFVMSKINFSKLSSSPMATSRPISDMDVGTKRDQ